MPTGDCTPLPSLPSRIPAVNHDRAAVTRLDWTRHAAQPPKSTDTSRACERVSKATCDLKQASRCLQESYAGATLAHETLRRIQQATLELRHCVSKEPPRMYDETEQCPSHIRRFVGVSSLEETADDRSTSPGECADEAAALQSLQCDYIALQKNHAQAQDRIKELELLIRRRWEQPTTEQMPFDGSGCAESSGQAECSSSSTLSVHKDAQGYRAMAARLAEEVVKFATDFNQADNEGDHAADRRRFIFWATNQVAPFLPMLK